MILIVLWAFRATQQWGKGPLSPLLPSLPPWATKRGDLAWPWPCCPLTPVFAVRHHEGQEKSPLGFSVTSQQKRAEFFSIPSCIIQRSQLFLVFTETIQALPPQFDWNNQIPFARRGFFLHFSPTEEKVLGQSEWSNVSSDARRNLYTFLLLKKCRSSELGCVTPAGW